MLESVEIALKYAPYLAREAKWVVRLRQLEGYKIRADFDYDCLQSLSKEGKEKLKQVRPRTLGQASRISGVSSSDVSVLGIYLNRA